jgi:hypothetical protein
MIPKKPTPQERLEIYKDMKEFILRKRRNGISKVNLMVAFLHSTSAKTIILRFRELRKYDEKFGGLVDSNDALDVINSCIHRVKRRVSLRKWLWFIYG